MRPAHNDDLKSAIPNPQSEIPPRPTHHDLRFAIRNPQSEIPPRNGGLVRRVGFSLGVILCIGVLSSAASAATYFSQGSVTPNTLTNWNTNRLGGGTSPANFTTAGDIFVVQGTGNGGTSPHSMTTSAVWSVGAAGSKLQIESGGSLQADHAITIGNAAAIFQIDSGGTYTNNFVANVAASIFAGVESFGATSNFVIRLWGGTATSSTSGLTTSLTASIASGGNSYFYGNLTINTAAFTGAFSPGLTGTVRLCASDLAISSTGSGAGAIFRFATAAAGPTVWVLGSYSQATGTKVDFNNNVAQTSNTILSLQGNFTLSGTASLDNAGSSFAVVSFVKSSGTQTVNVSSSAVQPWMLWTVGDGTTTNTVQLLSSIDATGATGRRVATVTINANAVLDLNGFTLRIEGSTTGNVAIAGTLQGTAASSKLLFSSSGTSTTTLSGAGTVNGGNLTIEYNHTGTGVNLISKDLTILTLTVTAGTVRLNATATQRIINLTNFSMAAGTLDTGSVDVTGNVTSIVNLTGNFSKAGGTVTNTSPSGLGQFVFKGAGAQGWSNAGTFQFAFITVTNNSTLTLNTAMAFSGVTGPLLTIDLGSTVTAGTQLISTSSSSGSFIVNGTLQTANLTGLSGAATTTIVSTNTPTLTLGASSTIVYNGAAPQAITGRTDYAILTLNNSSGGTLNGNTTINNALNVSVGVFNQGATFNLTTNTVTVSSGATLRNLGTGDLTLSGNVANAGTIDFNGSGSGCGDADAILIRSSVDLTQRTWSGAGSFNMTDVDVRSQRTPVVPPPVAIVVTSGTDSGNNTGWAFSGTCTAGTYTWVGGINADWQVATNWSPARAVPAPADVLILDGNATPGPIITNVPTQTIAALRLINSVAVTLNASAIAPPQTLTLSGATGTDLSVPALSSLTLASANALKLSIASGSTGVIGGLMIFQDGAHRLLGNAASAATFQSGAIFTTASGFTGNAFGTGAGGDGTAGSIIFANGSNYFHNAGASPFGVSPNPAVVVFQTGSKANFLTATGFEANGRTYADLAIGKIDPGGIAVNASDSGTGDFTFDNLSINSPSGSNSSLTFTGSGASTVNVKGNITSNGAGVGTIQDVTLAGGTGGIVIDKTGGTITFGNDGSNSRAIDFESSASVTSGTTLALARKLLVSISQPSGLVLTVNGSLTGGANGYVIGKVKRPVTATELFIYHVGTVNGYSPLDANFTAGTGDLTVLARQGAQPVLNSATSLQRYWNLTEGGTITADLTFHYNQADVNGSEPNYRLVIVEAGNATQFPENCPDVACVDETANTIRRIGVETFSDWTAGEPNAPTAVNLTGFTAERNQDEVTLRWSSGYEARNLGYNIYREQNGQRTRLTPSLVAGSALVAGRQTEMTAGRSYTWYDQLQKAEGRGQKAEGKAQVTYWLEDVDLDGTRTMHGPIVPVNVYSLPKGGKITRSDMIGEVGRRSAASGVLFDGWAASFAEQQARITRPPFADPDRTVLQRDIESRPGVKIAIKKSGYYRITQPELLAAGIDPNTNWPQLQLYANGRPVPIKQSGDEVHLTPSDYIEFYAHGLESATDAAQTYYLVVADQFGSRIHDLTYRDPQPMPPPSGAPSFAYTVERKERMIYFSGLLNGDLENFFGQIVSTSPASSTMPVGGLSAGTPAQLEIALQGVTNQGHLVQVKFNGAAVGTIDFSNTEHPVVSFDIPAGSVQEGNNTVELTSLGGAADVSLVDVMRLTYARRYVADNDRLAFSVDTAETKRVGGFTSANLRVLDITDPDQVVNITPTVVVNAETDGTWSVDMQVQEANFRQVHTLLVFADTQPTSPDSVKHNNPSSWWSQTAGADYVIITSRELLAGLEPLAQLRRNQGLVVQVIDVEDLYDEFSFGKHSPEAIQGFLQLTKDTWTSKPRYVLLAGDASYDPKDYFGQGQNDLVPTRLIDTSLLETASDDWLADFNGDGVADMAVGRLPVRTAGAADLLVAKIVNYENTAPDPSRGALLVSDTSFESLSSSVQTLLPAGLPVQSINRGSGNDAAIHNQIVASINQGPRVANYFGHGSNGVWTSASLLSNPDAALFTNTNRLSVFTMMTCFNGFFHDAYNDSLAEALLKAQGGAVAVWASTSMTEPGGQATIDQEFYRMIFAVQPATLGDAARAAKLTTSDADVRRTWTLFGDPAMRIR